MDELENQFSMVSMVAIACTGTLNIIYLNIKHKSILQSYIISICIYIKFSVDLSVYYTSIKIDCLFLVTKLL